MTFLTSNLTSNLTDLMYWLTILSVRTPPLPPVVDGDHLILRDLLSNIHLEYPPQLRTSQQLVGLQTVNN